MSKFIVVSTGNNWALAEDVDGSGVSYGTIDLQDYVTLKTIATSLNAKAEVDEALVITSTPLVRSVENRVARLVQAGLDSDAISEEIEAYNEYKDSDGDYHFDYYSYLESGELIDVCETLNSVEKYLDALEDRATAKGLL